MANVSADSAVDHLEAKQREKQHEAREQHETIHDEQRVPESCDGSTNVSNHKRIHIFSIGAARVREQGERSFQEIGKMHRTGNTFIDRSHRRRQGGNTGNVPPPHEIEKIVVEKWCYFRRLYF